MSQLALRNDRTGDVVVSSLTVADNFFTRFRGLQFRRSLARDTGLLLVPCGSIHTFWMRFPIDVYFLSNTGRVVEMKQEVSPWRCAVGGKQAHAVLEVASGAISNDIQVGDQLRLVTDQSAKLAKCLDFLPSDVPR